MDNIPGYSVYFPKMRSRSPKPHIGWCWWWWHQAFYGCGILKSGWATLEAGDEVPITLSKLGNRRVHAGVSHGRNLSLQYRMFWDIARSLLSSLSSSMTIKDCHRVSCFTIKIIYHTLFWLPHSSDCRDWDRHFSLTNDDLLYQSVNS